MVGKNAHTGTMNTVLEWFQANPDASITLGLVMQQFNLTPKQASNTLSYLLRKNHLIRDLEMHSYRLRKNYEKREEFKVARIIPPQTKKENPVFPVLEEFDPARLTPPVKVILNGLYGKHVMERVQVLGPNEVIVWNSPEQLNNIRQLALNSILWYTRAISE